MNDDDRYRKLAKDLTSAVKVTKREILDKTLQELFFLLRRPVLIRHHKCVPSPYKVFNHTISNDCDEVIDLFTTLIF